MIDYFSLALMHGLIALAVIRLLSREDLDEDPAFVPPHAEAVEGDTRPGRD